MTVNRNIPFGIKKPLATGIKKPLATEIKRPLATGIKKPLATGIKRPLAAALAIVLGSQSTHAEDTEGGGLTLLIEEVLVTAQKREQNINDVPVAVTALNERLLRAQGINEPKDLKNVIPNLVVGDYQGETKISIRGVGQLVNASNPGVAIHVDGVYQPRASMAGLTQIDMAGVEVLRGPQGTTYGRNANGGAVNYSTNSAGEELGGYVQVSYAEFDESRLQGAIDLPISSAVRTRLTLDRWERGEGFAENVGDGEDAYKGETLLARYRIDADLSAGVSGTLIFNHAESDGTFAAFDSINPVGQAAIDASPLNQIFLTPPTTDDLDPLDISQDVTANQERQYQAVAGILNWDINGTFSLKSITAYQTWEDLNITDNDLTNGSVAASRSEEEGKTFTQELNLSFQNDRSSGVVGLFYLDDELEGGRTILFENTVFFAGVPVPIAQGSPAIANWRPYSNQSVAIFTDVNYDLSHRLSLIAGVRFAQEKIDLEQSGAFYINTPNGLLAAGPPTGCSQAFLSDTTVTQPTLEYDVTTPRIGLGFAVSEDSNLYATYSEGFKSGGYGLRSGCGVEYDQETVKSFEVGSKNTLADGRIRLNATAFYYDYQGYQIEQLVGLAFEIDNAEAAEVLGVELESTFVLSDNFSIVANASHQRSQFTDHLASDGLNPQLGLQDVSGNPLPGAPDTTANISFIYQTDNGFAFQLNAAYKSEINFREFNNPEDAQDAYTLLNANIRWSSDDEAINFRLFANNLTGEDYIQSLFSSSLTANRIGSWGAPRQIGVEGRFRF